MGRTVTVPPIQTSGLNGIGASDLYAIHENGHDTDGSPRVPAHPGLPYAKVPGTPPPTALNSPRKLAGSPTSSASTMFSRESIRSEMQRSSWGSKTSLGSSDSYETGHRRHSDFPYGTRTPELLKRQRTLPRTGEQFAELPSEVLELILDMLKRAHLDRASDSCATCWMRDLCNVSLASRRWSKFARAALYEDIQLVGPDSAAHKKKFKLVYGSRMLMLRRTLRSNPDIAGLVKFLKIPRPDPTAKGNTAKTMEQCEDLTASLIMACPNLEGVSGPMAAYSHSFRKIHHALSTRSQLRQMDWLLEPSPSPSQKQKQKQKGAQQDPRQTPEPGQDGAFLDLHRNWSLISTLTINCLPGATLAPNNLLTRTLSMLPSLAHLHLCNLPPDAFNDKTLLSLPRLHSLALTHIAGITSSGLSSFATHPSSQPLRRLQLHHTPLTSLPALARIFSNLTSLASFSLAQTFPPLMPEDDSFALWMMPYLASPSLCKLHWDITSHRTCANVADDILARSIAASGFPQLRLLRAPNDPDAIFQQLCTPVERIDLPTDRFCVSDMRPQTASPVVLDAPPQSPGLFLTRTNSKPLPTPQPQTPISSSTGGSFAAAAAAPAPPCTDLRVARLAAQTRLEKARARPRFGVTVTDEDGSTVETFSFGGFVGTVGSRIRYHLLPDAGSSDDRGGAVDARDLGADGGESLAGGRAGCAGAWNWREGVVADKKEKERWWHTERGRWSRAEL